MNTTKVQRNALSVDKQDRWGSPASRQLPHAQNCGAAVPEVARKAVKVSGEQVPPVPPGCPPPVGVLATEPVRLAHPVADNSTRAPSPMEQLCLTEGDHSKDWTDTGLGSQQLSTDQAAVDAIEMSYFDCQTGPTVSY
jgi:hypothetical protein